MFVSEKFNQLNLMEKLETLNWKGRYFSINDTTTYLTEDNKTLAVVKYDNNKSLIVSVDWKNNIDK